MSTDTYTDIVFQAAETYREQVEVVLVALARLDAQRGEPYKPDGSSSVIGYKRTLCMELARQCGEV